MITRVLLINPPASYDKQLGFLARNSPVVPPMGLLSVGSYLIQKGLSVKIVDGQALGLSQKDILAVMEQYRPQLVGFTAVTMNISDVASLARLLKERFPALVTVVGGVHITALPKRTLERYPYFDYAVLGEGEVTFYELIEALNTHRDTLSVPGLAISGNDGYRQTEPRAFVRDLDSLPREKWSLLPGLNKYYHPALPLIKQLPSATLITGRGCIGRCIFCSTRFMEGQGLRIFSADRVIENVSELYHTYHIRDISFYDVNFMAAKRRFYTITDYMRRHFPDLTWSGYARVDTVDKEMLAQAKAAGCYHLSYGVESGNQKVLDFIGKGISLHEVRTVMQQTTDLGIHTRGLFMLGHPTESKATLDDTLRLILSLPMDDFHVTLFTPLPGTPIYEQAPTYGTFNEDWDKMNIFNCVFVPKGLSCATLYAYQKRAYMGFYMRGRVIWRKIRWLAGNRHSIRILLYGGLSLMSLMLEKLTRRQP